MASSNNRLSRRKFIGKSLAGLAGAGVLASGTGLAFAQEAVKTTKPVNSKPITRKLGKTGIELPIVSMGVMNASIPNIVAMSYEKGIRHFDTAEAYQNGKNETMVGDVLKKLGIRDKIILATKNLIPPHRKVKTTEECRDHMIKALEGSLKRLKTDYVDILYYHNVMTAEGAANAGVGEAFEILKKDGKIRFGGISTHQGQVEVLGTAVEKGWFDVALVGYNIALQGIPAYAEAIDKAAKAGIGMVGMKTQAGGQWWQYVYNEEIKEPNQTAMLKWVLRNENIATTIPGHTEIGQLEQNWSVVFDLEYTEEEKKFLESKEIMLGLDFCRQCKSCLASCPNGVEIPELMRVHMYAAQYRNFHQARFTYDEIPKAKRLEQCLDCATCAAECAHTVNIKGRIEELKQIYV